LEFTLQLNQLRHQLFNYFRSTQCQENGDILSALTGF